MSDDAKFGLGALVVFLIIAAFFIWGMPAIEARACARLERDIERDTVRTGGVCRIEVCPGIWLAQYDLKYNLDLIQSCETE